MKTVVITGGTRGIGRELALRLLKSDRVIVIGSSAANGRALTDEARTDRLTFVKADLSSVGATAAVADLLAGTPIDALVLGAGRFHPRRAETTEGLEHTFALYVVSRFLLAEWLLPPLVLNLCGTGGIRAGAVHWDDLQLRRRYSGFRAAMQGARANDLLGVSFAARHPERRYVLYNPLFVNTDLAEPFRQPARAAVKAVAFLCAQPVAEAVPPLLALLAEPPAAPLTALRKGVPVALSRPEFDSAPATRLHGVLTALTDGHAGLPYRCEDSGPPRN